MGQNKNKNFVLFREWLEMVKPDSASEITSNIRKLELYLAKSRVSGDPVGNLCSLYGKLARYKKQKSRVSQDDLLVIKLKIRDFYHALTDKGRIKQNDDLSKCTKGQLNKYQTAFLYYVRFLGDVFNAFTLRQLENEKIIVRERSKEGTLLSGILTGDMLRKGLFKIFKKFKLFASSDGKMVTMSLDTLMEIIEEYAAMYGADTHKDLYTATSYIVATDLQILPKWENWESIFISNVSTEINGETIDLANADEVKFDRYTDELEISDSCGNIQSYQVERTFIDRKSQRSKLSLRILSQLPMREQRPFVEKLTNSCKEIASETKKYREIITEDIDREERQKLLPEALEQINLNRVFQSAVDALSALAEYARGFRIELVAE